MQQYQSIVKEILSPKRYQHTLGVVDAAKDLAMRYGGDVQQAQIAGMLHDITKECSVPEQISFCAEFSIGLTNLELRSPKLLHAKTGAGYAQHRLGVDDPMILDALRYHTTGRRDMTKLDKILYLADYIEVNRDFPGVDEVRALIDQGLDVMMCQAMKQTIGELLDKPAPIHPDTFECYNQLLLERAR